MPPLITEERPTPSRGKNFTHIPRQLAPLVVPAPPPPVVTPEPPAAPATTEQSGLYPVPVKQFLALAAGLVLLVLLTRVPFVSSYLFNWDAGNYALGLDYFNIAWHQPHPPGYPVYIAAGRLLRLITGDANAAFDVLSVAASAFSVVALAGLTWRLAGLPTALVASAIFVSSPNVWGHGLIASPRILLALVAATLAWLAVETRWGRRDYSILGAAILALGGGLRPDLLLFFVGVWIYAAAARGPRAIVRGAIVGALVMAAWLIPSVYSIGWGSYTTTMAETSTLWSRSSDDLYGYLVTIWGNLKRLIELTTISLGRSTTALVILGATLLIDERFRSLKRWRLLVVWIVPAIALHIFLHVNEPGHVLVLIPALVILAAKGAEALAMGGAWLITRVISWPRVRTQNILLALIMLLAVGRNVFVFVTSEDPDTVSLVYVRMVDQAMDAEIALIRSYPLESTATLSTSRFRQLSYYLPENYRRQRLISTLGILGRFEGVPPGSVTLPTGVQDLIVLDIGVSATDDQRVIERLTMPSGSVASVVHLAPGDRVIVSHRHALVVQRGRTCSSPQTGADGLPRC